MIRYYYTNRNYRLTFTTYLNGVGFMKKLFLSFLAIISTNKLACLLGFAGILTVSSVCFVALKQSPTNTTTNPDHQRVQELEAALAQALEKVKTIGQAIAKIQNNQGTTNNTREIDQLKKELDLALKKVDTHKKELESLQQQVATQKNESNNTTIYEKSTQADSPSATTENNMPQKSVQEELNEIKEKATLCKALDDSIKNFDEKHPEIAAELSKNEQQPKESVTYVNSKPANGRNYDLSNDQDRHNLNNKFAQADEHHKQALFAREIESEKREITKQIINSAKNAFVDITH